VTAPWRPWQAKLWVWLPAVLLCLASSVVYLWQTSGTVGRAAQIQKSITDLEVELGRLERIRNQARGERAAVAELDRQFTHLYEDVFGSLEDRLTRILRAVGSATRAAGLLPGSFGYSAAEDDKLQHIRFGIQFSVSGEYQQIRRLLAELQTSPEFMIVEHIGFAGEEEATSRDLKISLRLATVFAEADEELLRRLTGGIGTGGMARDG
jgi:Tfp pilus assembly protein PilO